MFKRYVQYMAFLLPLFVHQCYTTASIYSAIITGEYMIKYVQCTLLADLLHIGAD